MHACELLPVAASVADSATALVQNSLPSDTSHLHDYWSHSRTRLHHWTQTFDQASEDNKHALLVTLAEEVLFSEVLTRVWAAAAIAHDEHHQAQTFSPVAKSIFLGHQESRNRALLAILKMHEKNPKDGRRLNVLRQKCERWTDMFLAYFPESDEIERICFDPARRKEFAVAICHEGRQHDAMQTLTMASLEATARRASDSVALNTELNSQIASAVMACLPANAFEAHGVFSLLWQSRMEQTTDSTIGLVEQLLALECPDHIL